MLPAPFEHRYLPKHGGRLAELHLVVSQWNTGTNWPYRSMHFRARVRG